MSDLDRIEREAQERREDCVSFGGLTREHYDSAEAAVDELLAIAEERHQLIHELIIEARQQIQVAEQERDQALAIARALRDYIKSGKPIGFKDWDDVLADTAWVEEA